MIRIENAVYLNTKQMEFIISGMRNPMNSWDKMDSHDTAGLFFLGDKDKQLMKKLAKSGTDHRKFMRMIPVYVDITAPLYWWKEFDTYKVGTVANSCSTMHKIHAKEFTLEDFSCEHLMGMSEQSIPYSSDVLFIVDFKIQLEQIISSLNNARQLYLETKDKKYWWQMIQLLPGSYNQKRTVMLNYEVLANIYKSRKNHKLDEWSLTSFNDSDKLSNDEFVYCFCDWIENLPYSELITGEPEFLRKKFNMPDK